MEGPLIQSVLSIGLFLAAALLPATAGEIAPRYRATFPLGSPVMDLEISGSFAFGAAGTRGVIAIDLSTPTSPRIMGEVKTPGSARELEISGTLAFVACVDGGLQIIDISDPTNLRIVGSTPMTACTDIAVAGSTAYALTHYDIAVIDASDPSRPTIAQTITGTYSARIAGNDRILCAMPTGPGDGRVTWLYDLTEPLHPRQISSINRSGGQSGWDSFIDVEISNDTVCLASQLYYACCEGWVYPERSAADVYDVSNLNAPGYQQPAPPAQRLWSDGKFLLSANTNQLGISEFGPGGGFLQRCTIDARVTGGGVSYADHLFLVSDTNLLIYELTLANPRSSSSILDNRGVVDVVTQGNFAYAATRDGLKILNIADPARPELMGELSISSPVSVLVRDQYAYLSGRGGLDTVDIRDPRNPQLASHLDVPLQKIFFIGDHIYSCSPPYNSYLFGFDLAVPSLPQRGPNLFGAYLPIMLGVSRQYAFVNADNSVVYAVDTITAQRGGALPGAGQINAFFTEDRAYLTHGGSFEIYNITNVFASKLLGSVNSANGEVTILGNFAYIADGSSLVVCDISDETAPRIVARNNSLAAYRPSTDGRRIHIASNNDGYSILEPYPQIWFRTRSTSPFSFLIDGPSALTGQIQRSGNLVDWADWLPITFSDEPAVLDIPTADPPQFYRFRAATP